MSLIFDNTAILYITKWIMLRMKNLNNWAHKSDCNHTFDTHVHFYFILVLDNL